MIQKRTSVAATGTDKGGNDVTPEKDYLKSLVHQFWDYVEAELAQDEGVLEIRHEIFDGKEQ